MASNRVHVVALVLGVGLGLIAIGCATVPPPLDVPARAEVRLAQPTSTELAKPAPAASTPVPEVVSTIAPIPTITAAAKSGFGPRMARTLSPGIHRCYEKALLAKPTLAGTVVVEFDIGTDGALSSPVAGRGTTVTDENLLACILSGFRRISFPGGGETAVHVRYPIRLTPDEN